LTPKAAVTIEAQTSADGSTLGLRTAVIPRRTLAG
jgi:hypothetical protein